MLKSDEYYMKIALELAQMAYSHNEVPVGAVIISKDGDIIGRGFNFSIASNDPTSHAEIVALREAGAFLKNYRLNDTTMFVTIEPCPMCAGALINARVKRLVFGASYIKAGACGSIYNLVNDRRLNHRLIVTGGVLEQEARGLIQGFFRDKRTTTHSKNA